MQNLLTIDETSKYLRLSKSNVYRRTKKGLIPCVRLGNRLLFDEAELTNYIESKKIAVVEE
jgi:excisionase family DNA binding protein